MLKFFYSIKDELVGFNDPILMVNDSIAIRVFTSSVNTIDELKNNAKDYSLYCLGSFDSDTGLIESADSPIKVVDALSVYRKEYD